MYASGIAESTYARTNSLLKGLALNFSTGIIKRPPDIADDVSRDRLEMF